MISCRVLYLTALLCAFTGFSSFAQETIDTAELSKASKNAKIDELYFEALKNKSKDDNKQAVDLLQQYVKQRPEVSAAYYELAKLYAENRKLELAETNIKKAIELAPDNKWYKEALAAILALGSKFDQAAAILGELSKAEARDANYPEMAAQYSEKAKKYNDAITYLDMALSRNCPDRNELTMDKVRIYLAMNNVEKAAEMVRQLIASEPKNGRLYKLLGELYDNNKLPAKAADVYEKALKALPGDPFIQMGLAGHYLTTGDTAAYKKYAAEAIMNKNMESEEQVALLRAYVASQPNEAASVSEGLPLIRELAAIHPNEAQVLSLYGDFLDAANQPDSAVKMYKRALEIKPSDFEVWRKLLSNSTGKNDADSLIRYSERAMRLFPNQALTHYFNGIGYSNKKQYTQAIKSINRAIDNQPESDKAILGAMYSTLGDIYNSLKEYARSDEAFEKALELEPNDASVLNNYSYYLSERGKKLDEAEKMSKKSLELRPNEGTFLDTYGWILYKKGDYVKARENIQKAVDLSGGNADATLIEHLGDVYYKLNNKDKAIENWKIAKQKGGDTPQLDKKINEGKLYE
jgi:tetratricopeptide (TPR) repeat protein